MLGAVPVHRPQGSLERGAPLQITRALCCAFRYTPLGLQARLRLHCATHRDFRAEVRGSVGAHAMCLSNPGSGCHCRGAGGARRRCMLPVKPSNRSLLRAGLFAGLWDSAGRTAPIQLCSIQFASLRAALASSPRLCSSPALPGHSQVRGVGSSDANRCSGANCAGAPDGACGARRLHPTPPMLCHLPVLQAPSPPTHRQRRHDTRQPAAHAAQHGARL